MKKGLIFLILLGGSLSCYNKECMNEPPYLCIIVVNNAMNDRELLESFEYARGSAILYKLVDNKKVKIGNFPIANKNIRIADGGKSLKPFYTGALETFYLEYDNKMDTLQVKGDYHETKHCGDVADLSELYFNHKKTVLKPVIGAGNTFRVDNTE